MTDENSKNRSGIVYALMLAEAKVARMDCVKRQAPDCASLHPCYARGTANPAARQIACSTEASSVMQSSSSHIASPSS